MFRKIWVFLLVVWTGLAFAADISIQVNPQSVAVGEPFQLRYSVQGDAGEPDFAPLQQDFSLMGNSTSSQFSIINGRSSSSRIYQLTLAANKEGELTIPPVHFGDAVSEAVSISVHQGSASSAPKGAGGVPAGDDLLVLTEVDNPKPYVQQQVMLKVRILRRIDWKQAGLSELDSGGKDVLAQQLGDDKSYQTQYDGKTYQVVERRYLLFPQQSGKLRIEPFKLTAVVPTTGSRRAPQFGQFPDFFSSGQVVQRVATSDAVELDVQPIPAEFKGTHWLVANSISLSEAWSKPTNQIHVGDSVTRTIGLIADGVSLGNLPQIEMQATSSLKVYPDQPAHNEQAGEQGTLSTSNFKFALIPSQPGRIELPEIRIPWWNANTSKMEVASLPAVTLEVSPADGQAAPEPAPVAEPAQPAAQPSATPMQPTVPQASAANNTPATPEPVETSVEARPWWQWVIAGLLILWLVTLFAWWRRGKPQAAPASINTQPVEPTPTADVSALASACQARDARAARDAVMQLAHALWPQQRMVSLEDVQSRVKPELAAELRALNTHLYGASQRDWNADLILSGMTELAKQLGNANKAGDPALVALHRLG